MKVISPIVIADANLSSSTVAETTPAAWNSATDYAVGAQVNVSHVIYESVQTPNVNHAPASSPLYWAAAGPSNRWAMFDNEISTATVDTTAITVVLLPGNINALALFGLIGSQVVATVKQTAGGAVAWTQTMPLDGSIITDWYQYFFEPFRQRTEAVFTGLPPYSAGEITVAITGSGTVACAHLAIGTAYDLGEAILPASSGIIDYSRKEVSPTGAVSLQKRKFSRRMSLQTLVDNSTISKLQSVLADLRATPCAWIGHDSPDLNLLTIYGFYRDFSIDIAYAQHSLCNIEIEGMT